MRCLRLKEIQKQNTRAQSVMASSKKSSLKAHVLSWKLARTFLLLVACETRQNLGSQQATASNTSYISRYDSTVL